MVRAAAVFSKCMKTTDVGLSNEFYYGVDSLDGIDSWHEYFLSNGGIKLTGHESQALHKDAFFGSIPGWGGLYHKPEGIWTSFLDIDKNSYYIARDNKGNIIRDKNGDAVYRYHDTGEIVDRSKVQDAKEKKLFFFTKKKQRMFLAPSRYTGVKWSMLNYVNYLKKNFPNIMTLDGYEVLGRAIKKFFYDIENGEGKKGWRNVIYNLYTSQRGNHRYLMSEVMGETFERMMSDKDVAQRLLGYDFSDVNFRDFAEAAAVYANTARGGNITVVDILGKKYRDSIYGIKASKLFDIDEDGKVIRLKTPVEGVLNKTYFMNLSIKQQIEQIKVALGEKAPSMNVFRNKVKIRCRYDVWGGILKGINFIGKPRLYSTLMSFGKGLTGFMPLLILNSGMFVTDDLAAGVRLKGDWKGFFKKRNLNDGLPDNIDGYSTGLGDTIGDVARKFATKSLDALNQGLFNIGDMLMENSYKVRQYQKFFEAQFPGIKTVSDINLQLEYLAKNNPGELDKLLEAARRYAEYSVRQATTNTPVSAALTRVHPARNPLNQPMKDSFYALWHFFAGRGYNKVAGAWNILKTGMRDNIFHGKIGSKYLDELLNEGLDPAEVYARMTRTYLENEDLLYFMHKVYTSFLIAKYLDRLTEGANEKNDETLFEDFTDLFTFFDTFSGEYAALWSTPQGRIIKNAWDMFVGELENNASLGTATQAGILAASKEAFRSIFRKLYIPQIATEYASLLNKDWDMEERNRWPNMVKAIQDNVNGYLFYLKDTTENGEFDYYIPKGPNAYVNSILGISDKNIELVNDQKMLSRYANIFNGNNTFTNWLLYSFPFLKQWNISQLDNVEGFIDDLETFRSSLAYQDMTNNKIPRDMEDQDWEYAYNIITGRLLNEKGKIDYDTLKGSYTFYDEKGNIAYNKAKQSQENLLHLLMSNGLTEEQAQEFSAKMKGETSGYDEEAIRTLAYIEAKTPGSSFQALAYLMNEEWFEYTYMSGKKYEGQALSDRQYQGKIEAAKKYASYIPEVDRYSTWPQFILHYAKTHNTSIAKYIDGPGDKNAGAMKLITPGTTKDKNGIIYQNKILRQNFQAQLMVDIEGANGNPNARKLMNGFSLIFDTSSYENKDGSLNSKYAAYTLNQIESIYNHINGLAMDENSKRVLKQGTLMFGDKLLPSIIKDEALMQRSDVKQIVYDWTSYRYKEFRELDQIAIEAAEDQLSNREWKSYGAKKDYLTGGSSKKFSGFTNWYDYMKSKAYSNTYMRYRIFDWTPRASEPNYLTQSEFTKAKNRQAAIRGSNPSNQQASKKGSGKSQDDGILVTTRRGKAFQFYKMEDPDKPVEYKLPWRKRWVRRGSGVKPISTTTWKHLTPKPKK